MCAVPVQLILSVLPAVLLFAKKTALVVHRFTAQVQPIWTATETAIHHSTMHTCKHLR